MANTINLSHEKTSTGTRIQHVQVNGIELSGRKISKNEDTQLYDNFIIFLNGKAQEILQKDPKFHWLNLSEFRRWANAYVNEFSQATQENQGQAILKSVEEANK